MSSRSGQKTSISSTPFSWASDTFRGITSSLASRITSPVDGSTTSAAAYAPSISASATSIHSMPASFRSSTAFALIFLPAPIFRPPSSTTSPAAFRSNRLRLTAHRGASPRKEMRSTA